ncbi:hypothetical protein ACLMJK_008922 [Lecanora helva]
MEAFQSNSSHHGLTTLTDDHSPHGLTEAILKYRGKSLPFLSSPSYKNNPRNVYLTENGQRPKDLVQAQLIHRMWGNRYPMWTLDLNGNRFIVKGKPNNGMVLLAKWAYFAWSPELNGFEEKPIAFSTINNNPDNISPAMIRANYGQKLTTNGLEDSGIATTEGENSSDDEYSTDASLETDTSTRRLRRDPLPGPCSGSDDEETHRGERKGPRHVWNQIHSKTHEKQPSHGISVTIVRRGVREGRPSLILSFRDTQKQSQGTTINQPVDGWVPIQAMDENSSLSQNATLNRAADSTTIPARPRRTVRPTFKTFKPRDPSPHVPTTRNRKGSNDLSRNSKTGPRRHIHQTSSPMTPNPGAASHNVTLPTPNHSTPEISEQPVEPPLLTTHKQARITLRVSHASLPAMGIIPVKLRSCMTVDTFFATILAAAGQISDDPTITTIKVAFDWLSQQDTKKSICVKKSIPDSFEVFLEVIDEAPCWQVENGKCEVAVSVIL